MNCLIKLVIFFFMLILAFLGLLFLGQYGANHYLHKAISEGGSKYSKFDVQVDSINLDILGMGLKIEDLSISNPDGWPEKAFFTLNEADCDIGATKMRKDRIYFDRAALDISEICIVVDKNGVSNIGQLIDNITPEDSGKSKEEEPAEETTAEEETTSEKSEFPDIYFAELLVAIDKIRVVDYSRTPTWERTVNVGLRIEEKNVDNYQDILARVTSALLQKGGAELLPVLYKIQQAEKSKTTESNTQKKIINFSDFLNKQDSGEDEEKEQSSDREAAENLIKGLLGS